MDDEEIDFTCIEIKRKEDKIDNFINLNDDVLGSNNNNDFYLNQKVIIFGINKNDKQPAFSNGLIKKNQNCFFAYTCNTYPGCSGGCIVNQFNNCVIGIHRGEIETGKVKAINQGIYIRNIIEKIKNTKTITTINLIYFYYSQYIILIIILLEVNHYYSYYFIIERK